MLWDAKSGVLISTLTGHTGTVRTLAFSPAGTTLATGSDDDTVMLWDAKSGVLIKTIGEHESYITTLAFSPDGTSLATSSEDNTVKLWDLRYVNMSPTDLLHETGGLTNLRVCRTTLKVIPLLPFPDPDTVWVEELLDEDEAKVRCAP